MNIVGIYEKLEKLVHHLPERLRGPILREVTPLKTLFLMRRPPRLLLIGDRAASRTALINAFFRTEAARAEEDFVQTGAWQLFTHLERGGSLRVLDARLPAAMSMLRRAIAAEAPDACLFLHVEPRQEDALGVDQAHAEMVLKLVRERHDALPPVFGVALGDVPGGDSEAVRRHLHTALDGHPLVGEKLLDVFVLGASMEERERLAKDLAAQLPAEARLDLARLSGLLSLQRDMAQALTRSVAAVCGAVGAQPIPLADFPILTSLQVMLVAGIMHISGREMNPRMAGQWLAALGANIGVALVLREGARAVAKLVPLWGDLAAGGIAAAGTLAIGRAATAYFVDGVSLPDAKELFRRKGKEKAKPAALLKQ